MKLDLSKVELKENNLIFPVKISERLSEEVGLHIGDGTMNFYKNKNLMKGSYALRGHILDDKLHYNNRIKPLYKELFGLNISLRDMPSTGVYGFQKWSDDLVNFKNRILGLPLGKKVDIEIPSLFLESKENYKSVIRGIFDTDGTIYLEPKRNKLYPRVEIGTISEKLGRQLFYLINHLNIRATIYTEIPKGNRHIVYRISVRGNHMLDKWMKIVEPHNPKHWKKYQFFLDNS